MCIFCVETCAGVSPYRWVPLTPEIASLIGVAKEQHRQTLLPKNGQKLALKTNPPPNSRKMLSGSNVPSEDGYLVRLLDDKLSRIRIRFKRSEAAPNGFEAEWRVANRNFAIGG